MIDWDAVYGQAPFAEGETCTGDVSDECAACICAALQAVDDERVRNRTPGRCPWDVIDELYREER